MFKGKFIFFLVFDRFKSTEMQKKQNCTVVKRIYKSQIRCSSRHNYIRGGSGIKKMVRPGSGCGHPVMCEPAVNGC